MTVEKIKWNLNKTFHDENRILSLAGFGGYAKVYLMESCESKKRYALKVANKLFERCNSFDNEVTIMQKFKNSPGFVNLIDYYLVEFQTGLERLAIVMDYLPGRDFFSFCVEKMPKVECGGVDTYTHHLIDLMLLSTLESVAFLHRLSIAHRDLKPENLRIVDEVDGKIVLMDFGLSCFFGELDFPSCDLKKLVGTTCYTIPLDMLDEIVTKKMVLSSDIYAIGMAFNLLVTGKPNCICSTSSHDSWETNLEQFDRGIRKEKSPDDPNYISIVWEMIAPYTCDRPTAATLVETLQKKLHE